MFLNKDNYPKSFHIKKEIKFDNFTEKAYTLQKHFG